MKLTLFTLLIALSASAQTVRPTSRLGPDFLKGLETDMTAEQVRREDARRAVELAVRTQKTVSAPSCPPYVVHDYSAARANFAYAYFPDPEVSAVDFRPGVPRAEFEFKPTVVIDRKSGWSTKEVTDALAKVSKIYAQCGIRIGAATVVSGTYSDKLRPIDSQNEAFMAYHVPPSAPKPWLFLIDHRANNEFKNGAGTSVAQTTDSTRSTFTGGTKFMRASAFIAKDSLYSANGQRNGYTAELVIGHELAHILTDGDHQTGENGDPRNLLASDGKNINDKITAVECEQMKRSPYLKKLN